MKSAVTISLVPEAAKGPFVYHGQLVESCEQAAEMGFDAVELFVPGPDELDPADLGVLLDRYKLKLAAVGTGAGWVKHRLSLTDSSAGQRKKAIDYVNSIVDFAANFGAVAIIGSMQGQPRDPDVSADDARKHLVDGLNECGEHAAGHQLPLIYEPLNRYETRQACTLEEGVALLEQCETTNVQLLADLFHMNIEEESLPAAIRNAGSHIGHVHFVDTNRRAVGCGHLDVDPVIDALVEIGYDGYLSAEALPWPDSRSAAAATIQAFKQAQQRAEAAA